MAITFDKALGIHPQALLLRTQRAEVLANNIANADTPNYKARDIDFKSLLAGETERSRMAITRTQAGHQTSLLEPDYSGDLQYRIPSQPSIDGNTVDMQEEQAEYVRNAMAFQASFTFLNRKFSGLTSAIKGE